MIFNATPERLVKYLRDGLVEQEHYGYVVLCNKNRELEKMGDDKNYPFFLRSCAKPLQATLLIDYELDKAFNMTESEIAICCASHAGEKIHTEIVQDLLNKFGITPDYLKCGIHEPVSITAQKELIKNGKTPTAIHNNCSGKHAMMLGICKLKGWDLETYDDLNHPLQQEIKRKIYELCGVKHEYPITKDGCGVPIHSMPLEKIVRGYLNLFGDIHYEKIKNAFLNQPYIIGGENRIDTRVMTEAKGLIAKVGAGGLCTVVNTETLEGFIVKICDANMQAREIVVADLIRNLHWGEVKVNRDITTHREEKIGEIITKV